MALFPSVSSIKASFDPNGSRKNVASNFWINSSIDDAKSKVTELTKEAEAELKKASQAVKAAKPKGIVLYSPEFYAACVIGGVFGKFLCFFVFFFNNCNESWFKSLFFFFFSTQKKIAIKT